MEAKLLLGGLAAACMVAPVHAQQSAPATGTSANPAATAPTAEPAAPAGAPASDGDAAPVQDTSTGGAIDQSDIIVTALRGRTSVQRTPAAVTVLSSDTLKEQRILDIRDAVVLTPAAHFGIQGNSTQVNIRGIGSALDFYWIPELVAMNIDGMYVPRYSSAGSFLDLESVQVLPGPQGVLYGRSAGGGAIVLTSNAPTDRFESISTVNYGNYDALELTQILNVPLTDGLALRGGVDYRRNDGFQSLGNNADRALSAKLSLLIQPTARLRILLRGAYFQNRGKPAVTSYLPPLPGRDAWYLPPTDPVTGASNTNGFRRYRYDTQSADIGYDLGFANVQYIIGHLHQQDNSLRTITGNRQTFDTSYDQYTQNLKLSSAGSGPFQWVGGLDWFKVDARYDSRFGPRQFGNIFPVIDQKSYSGYAELTYAVRPDIRLVAGGRVSRDELKLRGSGLACFAICLTPPVNFDRGWTNADVKGGAEFDVAARTLLYANVQTGYAPGTLNTFPDATTFNKEVKPQHVLAFTAGFKSRDITPWLTLNAEGFYYRYRDLIIQAYNAQIGGQALFNAPRATIFGGQLTATANISPNDVFSVNLGYTHARYGTFRASPADRDIDGLQAQYTPDLTGSVSYDRRFPLGNGGNLAARASAYFSTRYWGTFDHLPGTDQAGFTKSDASLTYNAPGDRWSAGVWGKNIEDRAIASTKSASGYPAPYGTVAFLEPPRTFGLTLGYRY